MPDNPAKFDVCGRYRHELSDVAMRESSYAEGKHLAFFCNDYSGRHWYWEIVEVSVRLHLYFIEIHCVLSDVAREEARAEWVLDLDCPGKPVTVDACDAS